MPNPVYDCLQGLTLDEKSHGNSKAGLTLARIQSAYVLVTESPFPNVKPKKEPREVSEENALSYREDAFNALKGLLDPSGDDLAKVPSSQRDTIKQVLMETIVAIEGQAKGYVSPLEVQLKGEMLEAYLALKTAPRRSSPSPS